MHAQPGRSWVLAGSLLALGLVLLGAWTQAVARDAWYPLAVDVWDPPFNTERRRVDGEYRPLERAEQLWRICVLIPHLKDAYWLSVNFALVDEARRQGIAITLYTAGGYAHLDRQREQMDECLAEAPDGILLASVSADGLNDIVSRAVSAGVPVLDLINGVSSPDVSARVGADFRDMGRAAGEYLAELQQRHRQAIKVAWFPGPAGAGWVDASDAGFRDALRDRPVDVVLTLHGDTGRSAQRALIEQALDEFPGDLDFIVGTAVTAEAGVAVLRERELRSAVGLLADYYSPGVHRAIRRGDVIAAPSDLPALQARIALDVMVRIIEGRDYLPHVAAKVVMIDREALATWDASSSLPPRGFRPIFNVGWQ